MSLIQPKLKGDGNIIFKVTTEPDIEPITYSDVLSYAKIDTDAESTLITSMITGVRKVAERWLGRALITQTITAELDWWPGNPVRMPRPPLQSITSIKTVDEDGTETVFNTDSYYVRTNTEPGEIIIRSGASPPINTSRYHGGYEIIMVAGYGDTADDVPDAIKLGLMEWVLFAVENRIVDREPPKDAMPFLGAFQIRRM